MEIAYPKDCTTNKDRLEFLLSLREKNKFLYNQLSKWASVGIDSKEYLNIPTRITGGKSFIPILSKDSFKKIIFGDWETADNEIHAEMRRVKLVLRDSTTWKPDLKEQLYGL